MSTILEEPFQRTLVANLKGESAQCVVDYLDRILRENGGILATEEGTSVLSLLYTITQSAHVFPRCYEIRGINQEDLELVAIGFWDETFRVDYGGQMVHLKATLGSPDSEDDTTLRVAVKEFIMWVHLSHENVLPFYGVYFLGESRRLCLVYPWISNNVVEYLTLFPESPRMLLISDIVNGLSYLHQLMIVHGNLKGSHVRVTNDGRALVAGFALSSVAVNGGALNDFVGGTMGRMAPELLGDHEGNYRPSTSESDVWSFSCLCYEIFTLSGPFDHCDSYDEILSVVVKRRERPPRPEGRHPIDDHVWNLMVRCWDYNPRNRPTCEEIWRFIIDLGIRDTRPPISSQEGSTPAVWEAMREAWNSKIDYGRVYDILFHASSTLP